MNPLAMVKSRLFPELDDSPVILEIDLDRGLLSQPPGNPLDALRAMHAPSMRALRDGLRDAATDDRVRGLIVHIGTCPLSAAQTDELGDLIELFGMHKPTVAFSESFGELSNALLAYRLATRAQQVWVQPSGLVGLYGAHLDIVLLRGGLEKLGVEPQVSQRHEYKSAAEQLNGREVSQPNREMMQRIADSLVTTSVATIARRRGLSEDDVWDAVDAAPLTATQAKERRLVDEVGYRDEVYAHARSSWGLPTPKPTDKARGLAYVHRYGTTGALALVEQLRDRTKPAIAVVSVTGGIVSGRAGNSQAASDVVGEHLRAAARDEKVKAVILRVDSPGGSYVASDAIWRQVHQLRDQGLPVIASMGDVAASGGYYVAMGADEIVATSATLTGSIGVYAGKAVTAGLFDKLGLVREGVDTGGRASMMRGNAGFTTEQWDVLNRWLDEVYADFTRKAAADRHMDVGELEPLARGRVWTGADAHQRHLVDHLGGMDVAIERACERAGVARASVAVRAVPAVPALERFKPADSSESLSGAAAAWTGGAGAPTASGTLGGWAEQLGARDFLERLGAGDLAVRLGGVDASARLGGDAVLLLPWRITVR